MSTRRRLQILAGHVVQGRPPSKNDMELMPQPAFAFLLPLLIGGAKAAAAGAVVHLAERSVGGLWNKFSKSNKDAEVSSKGKTGSDDPAPLPFDVIPTSSLGSKGDSFSHLVGTAFQQAELLVLSADSWEKWDSYEARYRQNANTKPLFAVFCGPPGTGKTDHARELARSLPAPLVVLNPASAGHLDQFGRTPFAQAMQYAVNQLYSAVILVDEIDQFLKQDERIIAEIRQAIDGAVTLRTGRRLVIIATTNKALSALPGDLMQRALCTVHFDNINGLDSLGAFWQKNVQKVFTLNENNYEVAPSQEQSEKLAKASEGVPPRKLVQCVQRTLREWSLICRSKNKWIGSPPPLHRYLQLLSVLQAQRHK